MGRVVLVVGARPQFVKSAPLLSALQRRGIPTALLHTGQHYDANMSKLLFEELALPQPDIHLDIHGGTPTDQLGRMLLELPKAYKELNASHVVVFGDTTSTLAGALAAHMEGLVTVHVEACLRSFNRSMPEEINRIMTDHVCDHLFVPTDRAMEQAKREGLEARAIKTGDIMESSLRENLARAEKLSIPIPESDYILLTLHRPYNVDDPERLLRILQLVAACGKPVLFPVHPRTKAVLERVEEPLPASITLLPPQGYLEFIALQRKAFQIFTDSGGVQKEAYMLGRPCVTLRSETEWVETVEMGWNLLVDVDACDAFDIIRNFAPEGIPPALYGEGVADIMAYELERIFKPREDLEK